MLRSTLSLIAMISMAAQPAAAQTVTGDLRDVEQQRPIPGARLLLLAAHGEPVDSTSTDRAGRFRLTAREAGVYSVYFRMDGWASTTSEPLHLEHGTDTPFEFRVPLISNAAINEMSEILRSESRLQESLPEICGEPFRAWEAGLLLGTVRVRRTREPVAGATVTVSDTSDGGARSTLSGDSGVYVLCNVPVGPAVQITVVGPDGTVETTDVEIRAGTASWYDLPIGPRR